MSGSWKKADELLNLYGAPTLVEIIHQPINKTLPKGECYDGRKWGDMLGTVGGSGGKKPASGKLSGSEGSSQEEAHVLRPRSSQIWGQSPQEGQTASAGAQRQAVE